MTGLPSSLLATDTARSVLVVAAASVLLGWWLGVVLLTLRSRRGSDRTR